MVGKAGPTQHIRFLHAILPFSLSLDLAAQVLREGAVVFRALRHAVRTEVPQVFTLPFIAELGGEVSCIRIQRH